MEQFLAHAVDVSRGIAVDRLAMHGLPKRTSLHIGPVKSHTQSLDIGVGLAVCDSGGSCMGHTRSSAHNSGYNLFIGLLLSFYPELRVKNSRTQPEVGVVTLLRIAVHRDAFYILQQLAVHFLHMLMVCYMVFENRHLSASYAGADI